MRSHTRRRSLVALGAAAAVAACGSSSRAIYGIAEPDGPRDDAGQDPRLFDPAEPDVGARSADAADDADTSDDADADADADAGD